MQIIKKNLIKYTVYEDLGFKIKTIIIIIIETV